MNRAGVVVAVRVVTDRLGVSVEVDPVSVSGFGAGDSCAAVGAAVIGGVVERADRRGNAWDVLSEALTTV